MKKTTCFYFFAVVILFTFVVAGCATSGDLQRTARQISDNTGEALDDLDQRLAALEAEPDLKGPVTSLQQKTTDLAAVTGRLEVQSASDFKRLAAIEAASAKAESRLDDAESRISGLEAQIKKVKVRASTAHRTAGAALEFSARGGRYFQIGPFSLGSAEIKGPVAKQVETLKTLMKEKSLEAVQITGFADEAGYKEESEQKNQELSEKRAAAVAEFLMPYLGGAVVVEGRGSTGQFGDRPVNRSIIVEVISREITSTVTPPTPASPPAATAAPTVPATSAPATIAPAPAAPAPAVPTAPSPAPTAPAPAPTAPATPPPAGPHN